MATAQHGWIGRGRVKVARLDRRLCLEFGGITMRARPLREAVVALCRHESCFLGPDVGPYAVSIWIDAPWDDPACQRRIDTGAVARASLDALSGIVWRDSSQVMGLGVEKVPAARERVTIVAEPYDAVRLAELVELRLAIAATATGGKPQAD